MREAPPLKAHLRNLALLTGLQLLLCLWHLSTVHVISNGDPCHYFAEARNVATGQGLTNSILCFYLAPPPTVIRPAGDYWPMGWSIVLGGAMGVFGTSPRTAIVLSAAFSLCLPLAVYALGYAATKRRGVAALAAVLVCLQVRLFLLECIPDVTVPYLILTTFGLAAALSRPGLAGALLGLALWLRGDGFVGLVAALLMRRQPLRLAFGASLTIAPLLAYNLVEFGRLMPAPRSLVPFLTAHAELYDAASEPSFAAWWAQGPAGIAGHIAGALGDTGLAILLQLPLGLLLAAGLGARSRELRLPLTFALLSWLLPTTMAPMVATSHRVVPHLVPCLCVLAAAGLATVRHRGLALLLLGLCVVPGPQAYAEEFSRALPAYIPEFVDHVQLKREDVVLAEDSWLVTAYLGSASLQCPTSAEGLVNLLNAYHPRYMVGIHGNWLDQTAGLLQGQYLRRHPVYRGATATLYEFEYQ